jgi:hypothetical protein
MTQAKIDAELGTALLLRTAFFSQNAVSALLEATDKDFKAELGKVISRSLPSRSSRFFSFSSSSFLLRSLLFLKATTTTLVLNFSCCLHFLLFLN